MIQQITDHAESARKLLSEQFKNLPNWGRLARALVGVPASGDPAQGFQETEDTAWQLIRFRGLDSSEGVQLDGVGDLVGQARATADQDDGEYLQALRTRIIINNCSGSPDEILGVWNTVTGFMRSVYDTDPLRSRVIENFPARVEIWTNQSLSGLTGTYAENFPDSLRPVIQSALPAAVALESFFISEGMDFPFGFSEATHPEDFLVDCDGHIGSLIVNLDPYTAGGFRVDPDSPLIDAQSAPLGESSPTSPYHYPDSYHDATHGGFVDVTAGSP